MLIIVTITNKDCMKYRFSKQRRRILEILKETKSHPTADWVYRKLKKEIPELSLGTVYRNLNVLLEQGHLEKLPFGSTFDRFEAKIKPHYHLICDKCGLVEDFEMPLYTDINKKAEMFGSFKILRHRIDFFGLCKKCQKPQKFSKRKE
jgi:Fur family transcriptional regulator, peroxide stress response regulator